MIENEHNFDHVIFILIMSMTQFGGFNLLEIAEFGVNRGIRLIAEDLGKRINSFHHWSYIVRLVLLPLLHFLVVRKNEKYDIICQVKLPFSFQMDAFEN